MSESVANHSVYSIGTLSLRRQTTVQRRQNVETHSANVPVAPIAGLIAFYNEIVDTFLDGHRLPKPHTHFV